jgi:hypothetical protein
MTNSWKCEIGNPYFWIQLFSFKSLLKIDIGLETLLFNKIQRNHWSMTNENFTEWGRKLLVCVRMISDRILLKLTKVCMFIVVTRRYLSSIFFWRLIIFYSLGTSWTHWLLHTSLLRIENYFVAVLCRIVRKKERRNGYTMKEG